jgi:hypothetical protein
MPRRDDNVVPFRRRPRKWTRPQDFGHDPRKRAPKPPRPPKRPGGGLRAMLRKLAPWAFIAALVALTVAWHFRG